MIKIKSRIPAKPLVNKLGFIVGGLLIGTTLASYFSPATFPLVGKEISLVTRSCQASKVDGTPVTGAECSQWAEAGPINVVVAFNQRHPFDEIVKKTAWSAASGNWLVLQGQTDEKYKGCSRAWRDDTQQVQFRLDPVTRRHWKMIYEDCTQNNGSSVVFGQAHTDKYDVINCGGDYAIDWDKARDALVDAFRTLPNTTIELKQVQSPATYPGGCKTTVKTDGYVAFVNMVG